MTFHLDTVQLDGFIAIADTGSFSQAAERVFKSQSALSLQIKSMEKELGCTLFNREPRRVTLTHEGEVFLGYARRMMLLHREAYSRIKEPEVEGEIRLGTPEDFATHYLPSVLASFRQHHPRVILSVACDLTMNLISGFHRGEFDLILVKRDPAGITGGMQVWREPLVWVGSDNYNLEEERLSLVLSPQPCIYRARVLAALDQARRPWHVSYTSPSLAGTTAAVKAGLGISVLPANMLPSGIHPISMEARLPDLADSEIALLKQETLPKAAQVLIEHIVHSLEAG
jgi:DNA-binding transcriptional LysR family regulator